MTAGHTACCCPARNKQEVSQLVQVGMKEPVTFFQQYCSMCTLEAAPSPLGQEVWLWSQVTVTRLGSVLGRRQHSPSAQPRDPSQAVFRASLVRSDEQIKCAESGWAKPCMVVTAFRSPSCCEHAGA